MKKTLFAFFLIAATTFASKAQKAFEKGDFTVDLGIGFGLYGTKTHTEVNKDVYYWNGSSIAVRKERVSNDTTDGAGATIYPLKFEYGVTNWLGVGARFAHSNYIEEKDSITGIKPKFTSFDAGIVLNFHLVKSKRFDMPISVNFGYSSFKYLSNDATGGKGKDNGINYGIGILPRIYFGDHVGMFFNLGYAGYNYPSIKFSNNTDSNLNDDNGQDWLYKIKGSGMNIGIGLIGKF
jgi:hypothetical protein